MADTRQPRRLTPWSGLAGAVCAALVAGAGAGLLGNLDALPSAERICRWLAVALGSFFRMLGYPVYVADTIATISGFSMAITPSALAGPTLAAFSFPVLLYPARWHRKLVAWSVLFVAIEILNAARLLLLAYSGFTGPRGFELLHQTAFPILFLVAIPAGFEAAARWMDRSLHAAAVPPRLPTGSLARQRRHPGADCCSLACCGWPVSGPVAWPWRS